MKRKIFEAWPILFLVGLFVIYGWPYFFQNKIPLPTAYLISNAAPWKNYYPGGPFKNAIPDVVGQIYPWKYLTIEALRAKELPHWNPYIFSGNPHLANFQTAVFSPFNFLFFVLPFLDAWSLLILFQYFFTGILTYILSREIGLSREGALLSSIAFSFSGFLVTWGAYGTLGYAISFLPLALFGGERILKKQFKFLPILVISLVFSFFSGHIQTSLYLALAVLTYLLVKFLILKPERITLLIFTLSFLSSFILILPQLLPTLKFYEYSGRILVGLSPQAFQNLTFQWPKFVTFLAPDFFGNPVTRNDWYGGYAEWMGFFGSIPFILASLVMLDIKKEKRLWSLLAVGILGLALATYNPISRFLSSVNIPIFSNSTPSRAIVLVSFAGSMLAGFGFDFLNKKWLKEKKYLLVLIIFAIIFTVLWFLTFILPIPELKTVSRRNLILPTILFSVFVGAIIIYDILIYRIEGKRFFSAIKVVLGAVILFLVAFDLLRFAKKWQPFDTREWAYPKTPVLEFLQKQAGYYRYFGQLGMATATIFHLPSVEGYDPLSLASYGEFIDSASDGKVKEMYRVAVTLQTREKNTKKIFDLLGVKYLTYDAGNPQNEFVFPVWQYDRSIYPKIYDDGKYLIFENKEAFPRVKLFYNYVVKRDRQEILDQMFREDFDLTKTVVLEREPLNVKEGSGRAEIVSFTPNGVEVKVETSAPAVLFFSDNYYPSWEAQVNGKKTEIFRANYTFKAVVVPEGTSMVKFFIGWP